MSASNRDVAQSHQATSHDRGGGMLHLLIWIPVTLAIYILSIGPVAKFGESIRLPVAVWYFYRPVNRVADHVAPFGRFLSWYIYRVWRCTPPRYV